MYRAYIKSDKQEDFRGVATQKVSVGFMPAGPQLAATETKRWQHSVRFIRAVATFLLKLAFACFRWHKANGELKIKGISE